MIYYIFELCTKMASFDFRLIASAILENELQKYPYSHVRAMAYELQESYESRGQTSPRVYGYAYDNFSLKQKEFIYSIADALMELCKERYGRYKP